MLPFVLSLPALSLSKGRRAGYNHVEVGIARVGLLNIL